MKPQGGKVKGKITIPDVWDVIELSDHVMPMIWTCETVFGLRLRTEMPENQHSWVVLTHED